MVRINITSFDEDLLELKDFAARLQKFIEVEHQFVEGSLVVALSSKFGSGKTTFLQMWKNGLESCKDDPNTPLVISLNAWESDYYGDPLFAIISGLVERIQKSGDSAEAIVEAAKGFGWFLTSIGAQLVQTVTGIDPVAAGEFVEKKKKEQAGVSLLPLDTFSVYQNRKDAMLNLKAAVKDFVESSKPRVLFLVDELDRCKPDYAIAYLETIKHIFDIQGAVFILSADRQQLENSAKKAFGPDLDFEEYYRKFIHREVSLPPISGSSYKKLASAYVKHYLQCEGLRNCSMNLDYHRIEEIIELLSALRLTPRQTQEMFRILGHILERTKEINGDLRLCLGQGSIAMAAFKVGKPRIFNLLGNQALEPEEAYKFLSESLGSRQIDFWFKLFLTGGGLKRNKDDNAWSVMTRVGLVKEEAQAEKAIAWERWEDCWGGFYGNGFVEIHKKIEKIMQWV